MEAHEYLGIGIYTLPDAARLLGVRTSKLRRWVQGYSFGVDRYSPPILRRDRPELVKQGILTFEDLIELLLVDRFRHAGVSMPTIRAAAERAVQYFRSNHPFALKRFRTDGKRLFAELEPPEVAKRLPRRVYAELPHFQHVLDKVTEPFFLKLGYEGDLVRHYWPLGKDRAVVLDPARAFGQPIDAASGVPTHVLYSAFRAGDSVEEVAKWFHVEVDAVRASIEYEQSLPAVV